MGDLLYNKYKKCKKFRLGPIRPGILVQGSRFKVNAHWRRGSKQNIKTSSIRRQGPDRHECPLAEGKLAGLPPRRGRGWANRVGIVSASSTDSVIFQIFLEILHIPGGWHWGA